MVDHVESLAEVKTHQHCAVWRQRLVEAVRNRTRELEKGRSTSSEGVDVGGERWGDECGDTVYVHLDGVILIVFSGRILQILYSAYCIACLRLNLT